MLQSLIIPVYGRRERRSGSADLSESGVARGDEDEINDDEAYRIASDG